MKNSKIESIKAREVLDSRGNPTVEVDLITDKGLFQDSVPSGASRGEHEAVELRDGGKRYQGKGVLMAVRNVNNVIAPRLIGEDPTRQKEIDDLMIKLDGTENKSCLGANAILGVSMAVSRAGAAAKNLPLYQSIAEIALGRTSGNSSDNLSVKFPAPCFNIINGGVHAGGELDFQEFMVLPQAESFAKELEIAAEIYHQLKNLIKKRYINLGTNVGDEGGFAPPLKTPEEALDLILEAANNLGYQNKIKIILDIAASQFYSEGRYKMKVGIFNQEEMFRYYDNLIQKYPISGLEDPFSEDDLDSWQKFTKKFDKKILIIGDDLLATNSQRIKKAGEKSACSAMILKPNQIGTITEAIAAAKLAKDYGWEIIVSHRSGETCDDFISDFAVGIGADFIKSGAPARGERTAKYNRLLRIEEG